MMKPWKSSYTYINPTSKFNAKVPEMRISKSNARLTAQKIQHCGGLRACKVFSGAAGRFSTVFADFRRQLQKRLIVFFKACLIHCDTGR